MTEEEIEDRRDALIEDYRAFLRGQGPEPDLSDLPPFLQESIADDFRIVRALADRWPELPPLEEDPVAIRLGLVGDKQSAMLPAARPEGSST